MINKYFLRFFFILISISLITLSLVYYKKSNSIKNYFSHYLTNKNPENKPVLRVKIINHWQDADLEDLHIIHDILTEKFYVDIEESKSEKFSVYREKQQFDLIIYCYDPCQENLPKIDKNAVTIFFTQEAKKPSVNDLNNHDLSIGFDYIAHEKYMRIPLYYFYRDLKEILNTDYVRGKCTPQKINFGCFMASNGRDDICPHNGMPFDGSIARIRMFHIASLYKKVLSGGKLLNNIGGPIHTDKITNIQNTLSWMSNCKFVIAYENQTYTGYMTEKLPQAYLAGAIPLYYGDKKALSDINKQAIIYAGDFDSEESMLDFIKKVDSNDELYCKIWNQNLITDSTKSYDQVKSDLKKRLDHILRTKLNKSLY